MAGGGRGENGGREGRGGDCGIIMTQWGVEEKGGGRGRINEKMENEIERKEMGGELLRKIAVE